jgi:hypothetical protein
MRRVEERSAPEGAGLHDIRTLERGRERGPKHCGVTVTEKEIVFFAAIVLAKA